jgi:hypothetical protein
MHNKYLKYKYKYLNLKMIGGTIDIIGISGNTLSLNVDNTQNISQLFIIMDEHILSMIRNKHLYIEYKLLEEINILDKSDTRLISEIKMPIKYVISEYQLIFTDLEEFIAYINENDSINDYSIYFYIMHKMIYDNDNIETLHFQLSNENELENLLLNLNNILTTMNFKDELFPNEEIFIQNINNKKFILKAIEVDYHFFVYINNKLKKDKDFILKAIKISNNVFDYLDNELKTDKDFVLNAINTTTKFISISDELRNDFDFMLKVIKKTPYYVRATNFYKNKEFILKAFEINIQILYHADDTLTEDENFITLLKIEDKLKENVNLILEIVIMVPIYIKFTKFYEDKEFILKVIKKKSKILYYVDNKLKEDKDFILEAIRINPTSFIYANNKLKEDKNFILEAIKINANSFKYVDNKFQEDKDFVLEAIQVNSEISNIVAELKEDKDFENQFK